MPNLEPRIVPTSGGWALSVAGFPIAITKRRSAAQLLFLFLRDRWATLNVLLLSASTVAELAGLPRSVVTGPTRFRELGTLWSRAQVELWERIVHTSDHQSDVDYDFGTTSPDELAATLQAGAGFVLSGDSPVPFTNTEEV